LGPLEGQKGGYTKQTAQETKHCGGSCSTRVRGERGENIIRPAYKMTKGGKKVPCGSDPPPWG